MCGGSKNCNVYQCLLQPPHNGHWTFNLNSWQLLLCVFPCCFMLQLTDFYIAFLYCVSMVKSKKGPNPPWLGKSRFAMASIREGNLMQENLNWSILRGAKHGKGEMKSNCSWQQSTSNFQRPSFTPKKGGSRKTTGVHASFTRVSRGFTRRIFTHWSWWQFCSSTEFSGPDRLVCFIWFYYMLHYWILVFVQMLINEGRTALLWAVFVQNHIVQGKTA